MDVMVVDVVESSSEYLHEFVFSRFPGFKDFVDYFVGIEVAALISRESLSLPEDFYKRLQDQEPAELDDYRGSGEKIIGWYGYEEDNYEGAPYVLLAVVSDRFPVEEYWLLVNAEHKAYFLEKYEELMVG